MTTTILKSKIEKNEFELTKKGKFIVTYKGKQWGFWKKELDFFFQENNKGLKISSVEVPCK